MQTSPRTDGKQAPSIKMEHNLLLVSQGHLLAPKVISSLFPSAIAWPSTETIRPQSAGHGVFVDDAGNLRIDDLSHLPLPFLNRAVLSTDATALLLIIDALFGPTKRDLWTKALACLADIPHLIIAVDNLALCEEAETRFEAVSDQLVTHAQEIVCQRIDIVPVDFSHAYNLAEKTGQPHWITGPSLRQVLDQPPIAPRPASAEANESSDHFSVYLCWNGQAPMLPGRHYLFDNGTSRLDAKISTLKHSFDLETMAHQAASSLTAGNVGYANLALETAIDFRPFRDDHTSGSFRLLDIDSGAEVAFGIINFGLRRATNIRWQELAIDKHLRAENKGQKPCVLWFTGLSASGKSTIASLTEKKLNALGKHTYVLDGDNVRHGLCRDLGFTDADRVENLRRVSETAKLFVDAGLMVLVSFISPFRSERAATREMFEDDEFLEIFVDTSIEECERRDPKGLYQKARAGQLKNFTGIDSPYEPPLSPEVCLNGNTATPDELADHVLEVLRRRGILSLSCSYSDSNASFPQR